MGALLEIREPDAAPREFLAEDGMTFGRSPQNHCVLADPTVGTHHFRIVSGQSRLEIEDLGSRNRTEIGGDGFLEKGERRELVPGLVFRAGKTVFAVREIQGTAGSSDADAEYRATALAGSFRSLVAEAASKREAPAGGASAAASSGTSRASSDEVHGGAVARAPEIAAGAEPVAKEPSPPPADVRAALERLRPRLVVACRGLQRIADLREATITVGSGESADIRISHPHVAREHARIDFNGRAFTIESLGSERETRIAGEVLAPGSPRVIPSETPIALGSVDTLFVVDQGGADFALQLRAARILLAAKKVSSFDYREAVRQAGTEGRHVGEMLLRDSDLRVSDWCEALERAARGAGAGRLPLTLVVVVAALAVIALLVYLFGCSSRIPG